MDLSLVLIGLGLLIFFAHTFKALFVKTRIPSVLLLMLIGVVIGPILHLVSPHDLGKAGGVFTSVTLVAILFESGTNLRLSMLRRSVAPALWLTVLNFVGISAAAWLIGFFLLGIDTLSSLFLGAAVGGTSSAVVVSMLRQIKPGPKADTVLFLESALSDIFCLIVALTLMNALQTGEVSVGGVFRAMGISLAFSLLVGFALGTVWIVVLKKYLRHMDNSMFTTFALAFILYGVCERVGWNGGLAVLSFGLTMANMGRVGLVRKLVSSDEDSALNQHERNFYSEIVFVLQTYFFVYIGISIQLSNVWHLMVGALLTALIFLIRPLTVAPIGRKDMSPRDRKLMAALGPKGLVAAVLASLPLQYAYEYAERQGIAPETLTVAMEEEVKAHAFFGLFSGRDRTAREAGRSLKDLDQPGTLVLEPEAMAQAGGNLPAVSPETFDRAVKLAYTGQSLQNVAYAAVLFSILLCSILVALIDLKPKKAKEEEADGETPSGDYAETASNEPASAGVSSETISVEPATAESQAADAGNAAVQAEAEKSQSTGTVDSSESPAEPSAAGTPNTLDN